MRNRISSMTGPTSTPGNSTADIDEKKSTLSRSALIAASTPGYCTLTATAQLAPHDVAGQLRDVGGASYCGSGSDSRTDSFIRRLRISTAAAAAATDNPNQIVRLFTSSSLASGALSWPIEITPSRRPGSAH